MEQHERTNSSAPPKAKRQKRIIWVVLVHIIAGIVIFVLHIPTAPDDPASRDTIPPQYIDTFFESQLRDLLTDEARVRILSKWGEPLYSVSETNMDYYELPQSKWCNGISIFYNDDGYVIDIDLD